MTGRLWWRAEWAWAMLMAAGLLGLLYMITPVNMDIVMLGDGTTYTEMVKDLWGGRGHMHRYRILVPAIVGWLPMTVDHAFRLVQYVSCFAGALFTYGIVRRLGIASRSARLAVPMYLLTWPTLWNLYQYRLVDATACAFVAAALWLMLRGCPKTAMLVAGVGILAKEGVGLMIPLAAWVALSQGRSRRELLLLGGAILLAMVPHLIVRGLVSGAGLFAFDGEPGAGLTGTLTYLKIWPQIQLREVGLWRSIAFIFIPFSVLWMLAPLGWARMDPRLRRVLAAWMVLTMPLVLLGSPERMVEVQAPALIPLAVQALAGAGPWTAGLIVVGNGIFLLRLVCAIVPFWAAWGALGVAVLAAATVWRRRLADRRGARHLAVALEMAA